MIELVQVKVFRIEGEIKKPGYFTKFSKEYRALTEKDAVEKLYATLGGGERVKRFQVSVIQIKEIDATEATDPVVRELAGV